MADISAFLNAVRDTATNAYQNTVPLATADNITDVGNAVLSAPASVQNEFITALVNQIGLVIQESKVFTNPLTGLRKGTMEYGMTIEHIFTEMAESTAYTTGTRGLESIPDQFAVSKSVVDIAFYSALLSRQYFKTIHRTDLRRAFFNGSQLTSFIQGIMNSLRSAEEFDDYRMTIALLARQIEEAQGVATWKGKIELVTDYNAIYTTDTVTAATALQNQNFLKYMATEIKRWSERLSKPRSDLNIAGVTTWVEKGSQRLTMLGDVEAPLQTNLLAWAFNKEQLDIGTFDKIDSWYSIGADDTTPTPVVTPDAISVKGTLDTNDPVIAVLYDPDMLKIYTKTRLMSSAENARGNYYNIFSTLEDIYAASPFSNFVVFTLG